MFYHLCGPKNVDDPVSESLFKLLRRAALSLFQLTHESYKHIFPRHAFQRAALGVVCTMSLPIQCKTALHTCLPPRWSKIVSSNPRPGLTLTLDCNWTPRVNPRRHGAPWLPAQGPPWVIISLAQSLTAAATALQPAITPRRVNTCKPFH